jgi:hypothetical protein
LHCIDNGATINQDAKDQAGTLLFLFKTLPPAQAFSTARGLDGIRYQTSKAIKKQCPAGTSP